MQPQVNIFSKEAIKARMLQNAATLWGAKNAQAIDPFVKLLIDAFSTEIFKVSNEVNNIKARMLEKVAHLLTPTIYTIPQPAHAIAFAHPVEHGGILNRNVEFFHKRQLPTIVKTDSDNQIEIAFTAVDNIKLVKAKVAAMFAGNSCFLMDEQMNKIPTAKLNTQGLPYANTWLAIEFDDDMNIEEKLAELTLYFTCPDFEHLDWLYSLLPYSSFLVNGEKQLVIPGINYEQGNREQGYQEIFYEYSTAKKIQDNTKAQYANRFIMLRNPKGNFIACQKNMPQQLIAFAKINAINKFLQKQYLWIEIQFPPQYNFEIIDNFKFILNAFPVINLKWKQNECKLDIAGNNIPLTTSEGEQYLFVDEVLDSTGKKYDEIPFSNISSMEKGLYAVRVGGMERFDERNAIDLIEYVLELTRDEVAAYSNFERDNVVTALNEMVKHMKFLERKLKVASGMARPTPTYVVAEPHHENEYMYASYWVTQCRLANNLRPGLVLTSTKNLIVDKGGITLVTATVGGESQQKGMDAIQAYRYALTTRDRIITVEDIKNFCKMELRGLIKHIDVKKGTAISQKPKEGFIRTVEISIEPYDFEMFSETYWNGKAKGIKQQIEQRAVDGIEYKVFFVNSNDVKEINLN